jgi:transcriptional regulator with XRE-family HTH domain
MKNIVVLHPSLLLLCVTVSMNVEEIVSLVKKVRREKGITQDQMSEKLGITKMQYSNYETCKSQMTLKTFVDVLNILEISLGDFFGVSEGISQEDIEELQSVLDKIRKKTG